LPSESELHVAVCISASLVQDLNSIGAHGLRTERSSLDPLVARGSFIKNIKNRNGWVTGRNYPVGGSTRNKGGESGKPQETHATPARFPFRRIVRYTPSPSARENDPNRPFTKFRILYSPSSSQPSKGERNEPPPGTPLEPPRQLEQNTRGTSWHRSQ